MKRVCYEKSRFFQIILTPTEERGKKKLAELFPLKIYPFTLRGALSVKAYPCTLDLQTQDPLKE